MILDFNAESRFTNKLLPPYFTSEEAEVPAHPKPCTLSEAEF